MVEGKKILVVEDVDLNREIVQEILEDEGMVTSASSGAYDAILMDIQMPVMDGHLSKPLDADKFSRILEKHS